MRSGPSGCAGRSRARQRSRHSPGRSTRPTWPAASPQADPTFRLDAIVAASAEILHRDGRPNAGDLRDVLDVAREDGDLPGTKQVHDFLDLLAEAGALRDWQPATGGLTDRLTDPVRLGRLALVRIGRRRPSAEPPAGPSRARDRRVVRGSLAGPADDRVAGRRRRRARRSGPASRSARSRRRAGCRPARRPPRRPRSGSVRRRRRPSRRPRRR